MSRKRTLNIHNTDRVFNLNLTTKQKESEFIKVTKLNEKEVEREMDALKKTSSRFNKRNSKKYLLYKHKYADDTVQEKVFDHGGHIFYYTPDRVPMPIISKLASVPQSEVVYNCKKEYTVEDVKNVQLVSKATQVSVDVPIVLPDINPYDYLFSLYPLRYHVDKVKISFPALREDEIQKRHKKYYVYYNGMYHLKSKYKYDCFRFIQEPLSTWKMNIWLVCDSRKDMKRVESMVVRDNKRFKKAGSKTSSQGGYDIDSKS
ncbi:hypothetical protein FDJ58_gp172 [Bacillus phage SIOphi]|uniref:Uncharacterized protein n=1 Tax=Bacillus phage SIOphi TaxID=1285382 RepID=R4JMU4_9CAUD|nr:hypothetical protein FDJ58_gp172 [Bacillus phage SIOphi]AGK86980.1 hypothetical protein SIOphi_00860 [Bacillus phage SIOphi]